MEAKKILAKARVEKLPIVDDDFNLKGLITIKDIEKQIKYPNSAKDAQGRLLCGAAVGITANVLERVEALVNAKVDVIVLDSAHGHSANVIRCVKMIKEKLPGATGDRRKRGHRRCHKGSDRGRCGRCQGRDRTWFHLYHPCGCRYRRSPGICRYGLL